MLTQTAIDYYGGEGPGPQALAEALGITRQAIYQWGASVPLSRQYQIQVLTGGRLQADAGPATWGKVRPVAGS